MSGRLRRRRPGVGFSAGWAGWFVLLPLLLTGSELAHAAVNSLVGSPAGPGGELFEDGGPGSQLVPALLATAAVGVALTLLARVVALRLTAGAPAQALPFALLAPGLFVLQENLEHALESGLAPLATSSEPTFWVGLALQLPFALAAFLLARALLRVADALGGFLARGVVSRLVRVDSRTAPHCREDIPHPSLFATGLSGRGPPARLLAAG